MIYQVKATILKNIKLRADIYSLELDIPKLAKSLRAGQFLHLRIDQALDPLLRRPFSIYKLIKKNNGRKNSVGILYKVVGKGTHLLSEKCMGEKIDILGPLGNGFDLRPAQVKGRQIILVAGGMGIAPLFFLAQTLMKRKNKQQIYQITVYLGMETKKDIVCARQLKKMGCALKIATDDGTLGYRGYVSDLLKDCLAKSQPLSPEPYIYACGPFPMLKELNIIASKYGLKGQVSVDEMIGCGLGACLGCVIKTKGDNPKEKSASTYKRICKDGPVFDIDEIIYSDI